MKQGWIQVQGESTQDTLAPKTLAKMVYVDEAQNKTLNEALTEGFVAVFTHTMTEDEDARIHSFTGPENYKGMGRAWISAEIVETDLIQVNGEGVDAYGGVDGQFTAPKDCWVFFIIDERGIHFSVIGGSRFTVSVAPALPEFEYTGTSQLIDDGKVDDLQNWRIKFKSSGTFKPKRDMTIDVFLVGGGGGGAASGGGGGYTKTVKGISVAAGTSYGIIIGAGGAGKSSGANGGASSAFGHSASGGYGGVGYQNLEGSDGGKGGSGGGGSSYEYSGGSGGSDGGSGAGCVGGGGGSGQGTTTREFGESSGTLYSGGGGGAGDINGGSAGTGGGGAGVSDGNGGNGVANTGGGGGGSDDGDGKGYGGAGGSGIVIIRNARTP